jgi:hypothetical protein
MDRPYEELDDVQLLASYEAVSEDAKKIREEIEHRMMEREATSIPSIEYQCEFKVANRYDYATLVPLKERLTSSDLDRAWCPAHQETIDIPERWDMRVLKPLVAKYGRKEIEILQDATIPEAGKFTFKRRG